MTSGFRLAIILFLIPILGSSNFDSDQDRYEDIFGKDYNNALIFLVSRPWITDSLQVYGINSCNALSVVFPELVRYSSIRDKIETLGLESLYVQYGKNYSDFSIGNFQMKPSFAEDIETFYMNQGIRESCFKMDFDTSFTETARKKRLERLTSLPGQVTYLAMFMAYMEENVPASFSAQEDTKLRYISTAYNSGFMEDSNLISDCMQKRHFYTGIFSPAKKYNYGDISASFYRKYCEKGGFQALVFFFEPGVNRPAGFDPIIDD